MNNEEQVAALYDKMTGLIETNKASFTLTFFDGTKLKVKMKKLTSSGKDGVVSYTLIAFTNDINKLTEYNLYNIKDAN